MKKKWIGIDIGGTKCAVVLAELSSGIRVLEKKHFPTKESFQTTFHALCESIDSILTGNLLTSDDIQAIGISCGGPLDSKAGVIICPPNLPGWINVPICSLFTQRYHIPCHLQNDANACALVEWKLGAGQGSQDMVFITMGTGLGAGIIARNQLLIGHTDMAGEIGHIRLTEDGPIGYGKEGSFEGWCSGGGIARQAQQWTKQRIMSGNPPAWVADDPDGTAVDAALLARYARLGDRDAIAFFDKIGSMLGKGLAILADLLNPEIIVIGSVFARCEDLLRRKMEQEMKRECIDKNMNHIKVAAALTGESIGDLASVMTAVYGEKMENELTRQSSTARAESYLERLLQRYPILTECREQIENVFDILRNCYNTGHKLLLCGNGGSCADCGHIAGELLKGFLKKRPIDPALAAKINLDSEDLLPNMGNLLQQGLPVIDITGHTALSTAVQNDLDPSIGPAQQVMAFGQPGDVLIGISSSGNAKNVALAIAVAKAKGLITVGLTGKGGGRMATMCHQMITVPAEGPADVQELHLPVYHALCAMIEAYFFEQ